jgi:ribonuclease HII
VAVVRAAPEKIDRAGLQRTNLELLARALRELPGGYDYALADGFPLSRGLPAPCLGVRKGDQVIACVAAASIVAKVTRDGIMVRAARRFRGYGFERHKGYGTDEHWTALRELGPSAYHRYSFAGVAACGIVGPALQGPWVVSRPAAPNGQAQQEE